MRPGNTGPAVKPKGGREMTFRESLELAAEKGFRYVVWRGGGPVPIEDAFQMFEGDGPDVTGGSLDEFVGTFTIVVEDNRYPGLGTPTTVALVRG